jgi:hypothetical protein
MVDLGRDVVEIRGARGRNRVQHVVDSVDALTRYQQRPEGGLGVGERRQRPDDPPGIVAPHDHDPHANDGDPRLRGQ